MIRAVGEKEDEGTKKRKRDQTFEWLYSNISLWTLCHTSIVSCLQPIMVYNLPKKIKLMSFFNTQNMCKSTALDWYTKHIVLCNLYKTHFFFYDTHGSIMAKLLTEFMRFDYNQILTVLLLVNDQNLINLLQFYKIYLPIKIYI